MSKHKWGCIVRECWNGDWLVADSTETHWLGSDAVWYETPIASRPEFYGIGVFANEAAAMQVLGFASDPPPTYIATHIEVKPLADEADRQFAAVVKAFDELKALCDRLIAERDAARAELARLKEGGK